MVENLNGSTKRSFIQVSFSNISSSIANFNERRLFLFKQNTLLPLNPSPHPLPFPLT